MSWSKTPVHTPPQGLCRYQPSPSRSGLGPSEDCGNWIRLSWEQWMLTLPGIIFPFPLKTITLYYHKLVTCIGFKFGRSYKNTCAECSRNENTHHTEEMHTEEMHAEFVYQLSGSGSTIISTNKQSFKDKLFPTSSLNWLYNSWLRKLVSSYRGRNTWLDIWIPAMGYLQ